MEKINELIKQEMGELGYEYVRGLSQKKKINKKVFAKGDESFMCKLILKKDIFQDKNLKNNINREIMIVNKIKGNFNFLANFREFFYTKSFAVFIYEFYELGSIEKIFMGEKMTLLEVILLMRDIFNGLEELKHMKIIHLNLNPKCIFMGKHTLKIGGYEYCILNNCKKLEEFDHKYMMSKVKGKIHTIPPEFIFNKMCSVKTPIFSFGAIFYKMIHQRNPTQNRLLRTLINSYLSKDKIVYFRPDLPPEFAFILRNALEFSYTHRLSPYELKQELNYLCSFIKGKEDKLRLSVFKRRGMKGVELSNFYEPGKDVADKVLKKKKGNNFNRITTSGKSKNLDNLMNNKNMVEVKNEKTYDNEYQRLPQLSASYGSRKERSAGYGKFRYNKLKVKKFLPGIMRLPAWRRKSSEIEEELNMSDELKFSKIKSQNASLEMDKSTTKKISDL